LLENVGPKRWFKASSVLSGSGSVGVVSLPRDEVKIPTRPRPVRTGIECTMIGKGRPVLFLHGIPTSRKLWAMVAARLQDGFTCIAADLPGMGQSPSLHDGSLDPSRYADEIESLRCRLSVEDWEIVGHDAGSTIAVHYAARYPNRVKRLVLCSPPVFPDFRIPWYFRAMRTPLAGECLVPLIPLFWRVGLPLAVRQKGIRAREIAREFEGPFAGLDGARRFIAILRWGDPQEVLAITAELLPKIQAPTLILQGKRDGAVPPVFAFRAASVMQNAQIEMLENGHFLPLECPELVAELISRFFTVRA
jgi:pimeloyl-ACP methyl ester carboxylesterase